jgi:Fe-S cluster assembly protein SufD
MTPLATRDTYTGAFEAIQARTAGQPTFLTDLRQRGFAAFGDLGFPTTRHEAWRFTNIAPIADTSFVLAPPADVTAAAVAPFMLPVSEGELAIVFVNGRYAPELSNLADLPDGLVVAPLGELVVADPAAVEPFLGRTAGIDDRAFAALNTALVTDGAVVRIAPNTMLDTPIHLLFVSTSTEPAMQHPRVVVHAGEGSQARIVESYAGLGEAPYLTNAVTEITLDPNAVVDHYKLLRDRVQAYHVASMHLRLARSSSFSSNAITLGGGLVRNDIDALLDGEGVSCTLNGLYFVNGRRLVDNHTTIHHAKPHCDSHELYKGILDGEARAVFNGKIIVAIDAQKTDAKQTNKALLLSEDAQINTKPELEIFADDVRCTHGATIGQLDAEALFYLRSRGLGEAQARSVLIHAFASDLLDRIAIDSIRARLDAELLQQLPDAGGGTFYE